MEARLKNKIVLLLSLLIVLFFTGCSADKAGDNKPETNTGYETDVPEKNTEPMATNDVTAQPEISNTPAPTEAIREPDVSPVPTVIRIEGMEETVYYTTVTGSFGYKMTMDVDRFEFIPGDEYDTFRSIINDAVYMTVSYKKNTSAADVLDSLLEIPEGNQETVKQNFAGGKYQAASVHVANGTRPDSLITEHYIVESKEGIYVISSYFVLEAAEGWGARMHYMTEGFEII